AIAAYDEAIERWPNAAWPRYEKALSVAALEGEPGEQTRALLEEVLLGAPSRRQWSRSAPAATWSRRSSSGSPPAPCGSANTGRPRTPACTSASPGSIHPPSCCGSARRSRSGGAAGG